MPILLKEDYEYPLPKLTKVQQIFDDSKIEDVVSETKRELEKKEISEKINRMPMNYFDTTTHGEVLSRVTNDVDTLSQSLNQSATQMITSVTTIIGVLIMMISISPLMTVIALLILPVSMVLISVIVKHSQKYFKSQQEYLVVQYRYCLLADLYEAEYMRHLHQ